MHWPRSSRPSPPSSGCASCDAAIKFPEAAAPPGRRSFRKRMRLNPVMTTAGICGKIISAGVSACAARPAEDDEYRRFVHMKAKRLLSLLLTAALMLSMMTPVLAASQRPNCPAPLRPGWKRRMKSSPSVCRLPASWSMAPRSSCRWSPARRTRSISAWCWASRRSQGLRHPRALR